MLNARIRALFDDYASSHQHPTNRLTHKIAIPLIVLHIVAMLDWVTSAKKINPTIATNTSPLLNQNQNPGLLFFSGTTTLSKKSAAG